MKYTDFLNSPRIDQVGIEDRVARITARSIKKESKMQGLFMALNMIDLTTLEGADTDEKVKQLCFKAHHLHDDIPGLPTTAAVCVYPNFVKLADIVPRRVSLMAKDIALVTVAAMTAGIRTAHMAFTGGSCDLVPELVLARGAGD